MISPCGCCGRRDWWGATTSGLVGQGVRGAARWPVRVLVSGAPGAGKTVLIDELRPLAADAGGWFIAGRFDQYRRDLGSDAVAQASQALCRLLLAEPGKPRMFVTVRAAVGQNANCWPLRCRSYVAATGAPDAGDPLTPGTGAAQCSTVVGGRLAHPAGGLVPR